MTNYPQPGPEITGQPAPLQIALDAGLLTDFHAASSREWLATNGIGGYASGTVSGANTRSYHGLLIAAMQPPVARRVALAQVEEELQIGSDCFCLGTNQYPGTVHPTGYRYLQRYANWPTPTMYYALASGVRFRKRIWMAHGENSTYIEYSLLKATGPALLKLTPLVCWRTHHAQMHATPAFPISVAAEPAGLAIGLAADSPALRLLLPGSEWTPASYWHYNVQHDREAERGLPCLEDLYCPGQLQVTIPPGGSVTFIATLQQGKIERTARAWHAFTARQNKLLSEADPRDPTGAALALAADQFVVSRPPAHRNTAESIGALAPVSRTAIIAGYPWFEDWGRDTMIALPGICLYTGRGRVAREVLQAYLRAESQGMLPNRFPDDGGEPEYNTVDAALWMFVALWHATRSTDGKTASSAGAPLLRRMWPLLASIVDWHRRGTRFGIKVDPDDGLLGAGDATTQLTWMDARVNGRPVTPRAGKAVELCALWFNVLTIMSRFAAELGRDAENYDEEAARVAASFTAMFTRADGRGLYDVLTPVGPDESIRPNQVFAVSLPFTPLPRLEQKAVVDLLEAELLTPYGLRTLSAGDPRYCGNYAGATTTRDQAYHMGTVWPWLMGPFVEAHLRVYNDRAHARELLQPLCDRMATYGLGSVSEVADGDPPYLPGGCIAQAWSVGSLLRAWRLTEPG